MRKLRTLFLVALLLAWLPTAALALTGQTISTFETYYQDDLAFINENAGRHLLPAELDKTELDDTGRAQYTTESDALRVTVTADTEGIVETCEIRLMIPEGTEYGNSLYRDFVTAGYHSYAFIMAMHVAAEPASRYLLVQEISKALEDNLGFYERQLGSYAISCTRVIGEGAVFTFLNNGLAPAVTETPAGTEAPAGGEETPAVTDGDDGANVG